MLMRYTLWPYEMPGTNARVYRVSTIHYARDLEMQMAITRQKASGEYCTEMLPCAKCRPPPPRFATVSRPCILKRCVAQIVCHPNVRTPSDRYPTVNSNTKIFFVSFKNGFYHVTRMRSAVVL